MFKPASMIKLQVVLLDHRMEAVTAALGRAGYVHLSNAPSESKAGLLNPVNRESEIRRIETSLSSTRQLMDLLQITGGPSPEGAIPPEIETDLTAVAEEALAEQAALESLVEKRAGLKNGMARLAGFPLRKVPLETLRNLRHLFLGIGRIPHPALREVIRRLEGVAVVREIGPGTEAETPIVVTSLRENRFEIESRLASFGFAPIELPDGSGTADEETAALERQLAELAVEEHDRREALRQMATRYGGLIRRNDARLRNRIAELHAQSQFGHTSRSCCITGWLPADREADARALIAGAAGGNAVITVTPALLDSGIREGRARVPVKLSSHALLKPFQAIVSAYGTPRYEDVEPSLFVAVTTVIMFGVMFGDLGHGLLLVLLGLILMRTRQPRYRLLRETAPLLLFCGASAALAGAAYGSVFGRENLLPALWLQPLERATTLFACAIGFGVLCISLALIFNLINLFRARDYWTILFDKNGIASALFYWGALALGGLAVSGHHVPVAAWMGLVAAPLLILLLREPLHVIKARCGGHPSDGMSIAWLTAVIETADTVSSLFSSTVSFVRVGAFALSHAALCLAVYAIADLLRGAPGGSWLSGAMIVFGNLFVILLEALLVMIQITRLQYYELFARYFKGDGLPYAPFQLEPVQHKGDSQVCHTHAG